MQVANPDTVTSTLQRQPGRVARQAAEVAAIPELWAGQESPIQFRVVRQVGQCSTSVLEADELLVRVSGLIKEALGCYHLSIALIEGDDGTGGGGIGVSPRAAQSLRLKVGPESVWGWVALNGKPLLVSDICQEPRHLFVPDAPEIRSAACVPLQSDKSVVGVLSAESDQPDAFDSRDLAVLQSLARQAADAVEKAQLLRDAQGQLRKQHDAVTQTLFSASLIAETMPRVWESDRDEGRRLLSELRLLSRGALAEMQTLLLELRPSALAETDLADLLRQLADASASRTGVSIGVRVRGKCAPPSDVHVAMYRVAQEALDNAMRHAVANQVTVSLDCHPQRERADEHDAVVLRVTDDGRGFEPGRILHDGRGLATMRKHAQGIGASLKIKSRLGEGTQVSIGWPASAAAERK